MKENIVKGWVVTDKDGYSAVYEKKPHRGKTNWIDGDARTYEQCSFICDLDSRYFDVPSWEDEPVEVEIVVRQK